MAKDRIAATTRRNPVSTERDRGPRESEDHDRQSDQMELSEDQRDQMLRDDALQNMLPSPPKKDGVHYFWASTTVSGGASIAWYKRMGYRPVRFDDLKGWADANMRSASGDNEGCISVNEMLLMQCNEADYQRYMRIVHHDKPNQESNKAADQIRAMKEEVGEGNVRAVAKTEHDGMAEMERQTKVRRPGSFE